MTDGHQTAPQSAPPPAREPVQELIQEPVQEPAQDSRASRAAVHSVHEFVFAVPDLAEAEHFYASFGLDVRHENGALGLYTAAHPHRWARIVAGSRKRLLWIALAMHAGDAGALARQLAAAGVAPGERPDARAPDGLWVRAPDGLPVCLLVAGKTSPSRKTPPRYPPPNRLGGRAPQRSATAAVRPSHLSHILLFTPDVQASLDFYCGALGLRLSDRSGDLVAFVHSPHGSDHHLLAFARSGGYGLHHSSWDVDTLDAVGLGAQQMVRAGYAEGWGLGRHVLGSNYFRYVRDPWGSYAEYSFDIDFIPGGADWPAGDYPAEDALYVWGPDLPAEFIDNRESAAA